MWKGMSKGDSMAITCLAYDRGSQPPGGPGGTRKKFNSRSHLVVKMVNLSR